jgi:hypothetical protein
VFGYIQEKIASTVLLGLCGVSMGDMRMYAGALRNQQALAHGVADTAGKTSGQVEQKSVKLASDASKEAQSAADAIGECDRNITEADSFMADIASFEQQLAEEKAYAQSFIAQIVAASHAQQARQHTDNAAQAQQAATDQARSAALGTSPTPAPADAAPAPGPNAADAAAAAGGAGGDDGHAEAEAGQIHAAADYVVTSADNMVSQLEMRSENNENAVKVAMTNHTGKAADGEKLWTTFHKPAKTGADHIIEEFKAYVESTKNDMRAFHSMSIDPSAANRIADTIIQTAQHLEANFQESQQHLDGLYERTYDGIRNGRRTLKSSVLDGNNIIGNSNRAASDLSSNVVNKALPTMNHAWDAVSSPIQQQALPANNS